MSEPLAAGGARRRRPWVLWMAAALLACVVLVGIFASLVPGDPVAQNLTARLKPPLSPGHPLGTDALGRDVLSRLAYGARLSLIIGLATVVISAVIGTVIGLLSGYVGGWIDTVIMRIVDIWLAFPFLLLAIVLVAVFGSGVDKVVLALVLSGWVVYTRLVRGEVLSLREREFVLSARGLGTSRIAIMFRHLMPNILPPVIVVATLELGVVIVTQASLSFLGLGVDESTQPTWGGMLAGGRAYLSIAWWLATLPGLVIFLVVLSVNLIGDALRDWSDPRTQVALLTVRPRRWRAPRSQRAALPVKDGLDA